MRHSKILIMFASQAYYGDELVRVSHSFCYSTFDRPSPKFDLQNVHSDLLRPPTTSPSPFSMSSLPVIFSPLHYLAIRIFLL